MDTAQYIILANIFLVVLLGFYMIFLKKETFFQLNRAYLLCALLLSLILPAIHTGWAERISVAQQIKYSIVAEPITIFANQSGSASHFTFLQAISWLYITGIIVFGIHLFIRLLAVKRIILASDNASSYSFFKKIYLADSNTSNGLIGVHENIHANQWHSADILLMEIVVIFNWFNPAVYFFRKELKNVHEFIADEGALKYAGNKKEYALLLLSQTFETPINNLVNPFFNQKLLKQRIMMIQKNKSQKSALLKYLLSAPLFALMLILSSATIGPTIKDKEGIPPKTAITQPQQKSDKVFTVVEQAPSFPGGLDKFYSFLGANIKYPVKAKENKVEGKVFLSFVIEEDGSLSNMKILRDIGYGCGKEAVRVMKLSPKWIPGVQNGKKVRVQYNLPITFTLKA
ncbi:MAG TPA: M56 family metallopeptidase [Mucilaginibacter sp.]|nr:M56 family metallopeptidase [Mucilaginibacter sp.]